MAQTQLTMRQEALVEVIASGKARTITAAAELAGISASHAGEILRKPEIQRAIEKAKAPKRDKARAISDRAASRLAESLDLPEDDPLRMAQTAGVALAGAKILQENFTEPESPEVHADNLAAVATLHRLHRADGLRVAVWLLRRGMTLDVLASLVAQLPR